MLAIVLLAVTTAVAMTQEVDLEAELKKQQNVIGSLTRQIMMHQLNMEEMIRAGGDSGIKQIRASGFGTRPWYTATHTQNSVNANHDHSQNSHTVGMGEVTVVINGVEFRTRHNDYALKQPHRTVKNYNSLQYIEYPEVPPEVLGKDSVKEQVEEMREWFKAWKDQNHKVRDYRQYFKPVLCYMEGAWTQSSDTIDEPFESDRHFVDATSWWDLTEKVRFTAYSGTKSNNENYSFLPMKIMNLDSAGNPVFAQWNYRILCAPITKNEIPTSSFRPIDDLSIRIRDGASLEEYANSRKGRFEISDFNKNNVDRERQCRFCFLDRLMAEVPGKDNYPGDLTDDAFDSVASQFNNKNERLNSAYYHRVYQGSKKGAMGTVKRNRGFADRNLFMAQTSRTQIPAMKVTDCQKDDCKDYVQRWSYAIPLEVIYLTPLYRWNPYNISFLLDRKEDKEYWDAVDGNGRNGGFTKETAYKGNRRNIFYRTPEELFQGSGEVETDPADTSKGTVGVLDGDNEVRRVVASGTRIFLPEMPGVGKLRTRYPISPLHNDGSQIYKEVEALKDIVTKMQSYQHMYVEKPSQGSGSDTGGKGTYQFRMTVTTKDPPGMHDHGLAIAQADVEEMMVGGTSIEVETDEANGHSHSLVVRYDKNAEKDNWVIESCDGSSTCWDGHAMVLIFSG